MRSHVTKTLQIKLNIPDDRRGDVLETMRQYHMACELVLEKAWSGQHKTYNRRTLHDRTYYDVRDETDLPANLVCSARNRVADAVKACVMRWKDGKEASKPTFRPYGAVSYDKRTITIRDRHCTLATVKGRVRVEYVLGDYQCRHLDDSTWDRRSATLSYRDETFYLNVTIRKPITYKATGKVMGVDVGVKALAVTSTGLFLDGGFYNWKRNHNFRVKRALQQKGTRSAVRTLMSVNGRDNRFAEDVLHCASRAIVDEARAYQVDTVAFEELTDIRDCIRGADLRTQRQLHLWAHRKLIEFTRYKAAAVGIRVVTVDPQYTSQTCSRCGYVDRGSRRRRIFKCITCGYEVHADYNASKNVGMRHVTNSCTHRQTSDGVGRTCQLALKSGTLTPKGDDVVFRRHSLTEAEFTDKLPAESR